MASLALSSLAPPAASLAPQRRSDFSQIVLRALITGAFVSLVNACVAGECRDSGLRVLAPCSRTSLRQGWPLSQASASLPSIGILYVPREVEVDCVSLLNQTVSSSSYEVYLCCRQVFQK